ncbi:hypothetical protein FH969_12120 [Miniimonas arenae]|uniref:Uncharacterized protein n=1 Tax=Miniimonas arenae TaxID=676201 RepID=A0A5C5B8T7_9MICO|nr:hypothetical protein FH969_12120 [Miniimonas arenae]
MASRCTEAGAAAVDERTGSAAPDAGEVSGAGVEDDVARASTPAPVSAATDSSAPESVGVGETADTADEGVPGVPVVPIEPGVSDDPDAPGVTADEVDSGDSDAPGACVDLDTDGTESDATEGGGADAGGADAGGVDGSGLDPDGVDPAGVDTDGLNPDGLDTDRVDADPGPAGRVASASRETGSGADGGVPAPRGVPTGETDEVSGAGAAVAVGPAGDDGRAGEVHELDDTGEVGAGADADAEAEAARRFPRPRGGPPGAASGVSLATVRWSGAPSPRRVDLRTAWVPMSVEALASAAADTARSAGRLAPSTGTTVAPCSSRSWPSGPGSARRPPGVGSVALVGLDAPMGAPSPSSGSPDAACVGAPAGVGSGASSADVASVGAEVGLGAGLGVWLGVAGSVPAETARATSGRSPAGGGATAAGSGARALVARTGRPTGRSARRVRLVPPTDSGPCLAASRAERRGRFAPATGVGRGTTGSVWSARCAVGAAGRTPDASADRDADAAEAADDSPGDSPSDVSTPDEESAAEDVSPADVAPAPRPPFSTSPTSVSRPPSVPSPSMTPPTSEVTTCPSDVRNVGGCQVLIRSPVLVRPSTSGIAPIVRCSGAWNAQPRGAGAGAGEPTDPARPGPPADATGAASAMLAVVPWSACAAALGSAPAPLAARLHGHRTAQSSPLMRRLSAAI